MVLYLLQFRWDAIRPKGGTIYVEVCQAQVSENSWDSPLQYYSREIQYSHSAILYDDSIPILNWQIGCPIKGHSATALQCWLCLNKYLTVLK